MSNLIKKSWTDSIIKWLTLILKCVDYKGVNFIECYSPDKYPPIQCGCNVVNVSSDGGRISEYHPQKLGKYLQTLVQGEPITRDYFFAIDFQLT